MTPSIEQAVAHLLAVYREKDRREAIILARVKRRLVSIVGGCSTCGMFDKNSKVLTAGSRVRLLGTVQEVTSQEDTGYNVVVELDARTLPGQPPFILSMNGRALTQIEPGDSDPNRAPEVIPGDLPLFLCHKQVRAAKITAIPSDENWIAGTGKVLELDNGSTVTVDAAWLSRCKPQVGGYYVVYGEFTSFSPAAPFEAGYTSI